MKNSEQPAFAKSAFYHPDGGIDSPQSGLTKREYFAAMAMQAILANPANNSPDLMGVNSANQNLGFIVSEFAAKAAIQYADELLKQLES